MMVPWRNMVGTVAVIAALTAVSVGCGDSTPPAPAPPGPGIGLGGESSSSLLLSFAADLTVDEARYGTVEFALTAGSQTVNTVGTFDFERNYAMTRTVEPSGGWVEERIVGGDVYVQFDPIEAAVVEVPASTWLQVDPISDLVFYTDLVLYFSDWMSIARATTGQATSLGPSPDGGTIYQADVNPLGMVVSPDNDLLLRAVETDGPFLTTFTVSEAGIITSMSASATRFDGVPISWSWTYTPTDTPPAIERPVGAQVFG